jgi:protein tyrosine/serine phosphatase
MTAQRRDKRAGRDSLHRRWRAGWLGDLDRPGARRAAAIDMMLFDHGLVRLAWRNLHEVDKGVWRANQPDPALIYRLAARGLRSVLNLRGATEWGSYLLEREACMSHGIELVDFKMESRVLPSPERLLALNDIFAGIERPFLMHCKSGADRAGFAAALYLLMRTKASVQQAKRQLSFRHLHFKHSRAGVLRAMLDRYGADKKAEPQAFLDWVATRYDPEAIMRDFASRRGADFVADRVLGRE